VNPWEPDTFCETHEWRSATGEVIRFVTRTEAAQRIMPPVSIHTIRVPQAQGGRFQYARHEARLATIPVVLPGPQAGRDELRRWARALDPVKGEGTLTVVQGPYAGRQLVCAYESGLESYAEEFGSLGLTTLAFRAADPYWIDADAQTVVSTLGSAVTWFPFLPLVLGLSDIFSGTTIENRGDVDAWPVITAAGPGTDLTVSNDTTGLSWTFTGDISAGSTLVVDHRPGRKSASLDGYSAFGRLSDDSVLWPLASGVNAITISFGGSNIDSKVNFAWRNRWLSA
jgi:hypothetical protein